MEDTRFGEPLIEQLRHPRPGDPPLLTAPAEYPMPASDDLVPERRQCTTIGRHRVIVEVAGNDLPQPPPHGGDRLMHSLAQRLLDLLQLCPPAVAPGLTLDLELALAGFTADEGEAEEVEGLRLAEPALLAIDRRKAAELDQAGLVRMKLQRELFQPLAHRAEEAPSVTLVLETDDEVVGIAHDDHVARGLAPSPAFGPQIEGIVQVDVGEQRRDHRSLPRSPVACRHDPVFQDAHLEPFLDQADDALVADPMPDETDEPVMVHRVEEAADIGVQDEVHLAAADADHERIHRVMRTASGPEPVREPEEVLLVDRVQHRSCRSLDDLVLQRGHRQWTLPPVRLGDVNPPRRRSPIGSSMNPISQILKPAPEVELVFAPRHSIYSGRSILLQLEEGLLKMGGDVVEERGELLVLPLPCCLPYAGQRL